MNANRRAFSLVELLIALSIIVAVVTITTGVYRPVVADQQREILKANLDLIRRAIVQFYNDNGRYPYEGQDEFGNVVTFLDNNTSELVQGMHNGRGTYPPRRRQYLVTMPVDPTLDSDTARAAGWKLLFADPSMSNKALPNVRGVIDVKSLNPDFADF